MSHVDIFISLCYGILSIFVLMQFYKGFVKRKNLVFFLSILIAILVAFPYITSGIMNGKNVHGFWTEQMWLDKINGESSSKDFNYLTEFSGEIPFILAALSLLLILSIHSKRILFLILFSLTWLFLLILQNNQFMHYLVRPILYIYPLNIIMWTGLFLPLAILGGVNSYLLQTKIFRNKKVFMVIFLLISLFFFLDYEFTNFQKVYRPGNGFILSSLTSRNTLVTDSDIHALEWLKNPNITSTVINPDNYAGYLAPIILEKPTTILFYEESYHDLRPQKFMSEVIKDVDGVYERNENVFDSASLIFIPSVMSTNEKSKDDKMFYNTSLLDGNYDVIYRDGGTKILRKDIHAKKINHFEAEDFSNKNNINLYKYPKSIYLQSVSLKEPLIAKINMSGSRIIIKHTSYWNPIKLRVVINNQEYIIEPVSNKLSFVESTITLPERRLIQNIQIESISGPISVFGKQIYPEVDWIETTD